MLRLQANRHATPVVNSALSVSTAIQKISGIDLDAGLGRGNFQDPPSGGFIEGGGKAGLIFYTGVQHPIVIVAVAKLQLFVILVNARADSRGFAEIKRSACDGTKFAGRNQSRIHGSETAGAKGELVLENRAGASQIEIRMVGEVDDRFLVGGRRVFDFQFIGFIREKLTSTDRFPG